MVAAMLVWSITYAVSLEFARLTRSYDYKTFFQNLIGRWSLAIEILMILLMFLIVSVLEATASEMFHALTGAPIWAGCILFTSIVALVLLLGTRRIETLISYWSFVLYAFYALFLVLALSQFGSRVATAFAMAPAADVLPSVGDGVRYAGYNIAAIALVLFTARNVTSRREALLAGALGGPLAMLPGALFFIAMMAYHPHVDRQVLPVNFLMERMHIALLPKLYLSVILITLLGTAATVLHSLNRRIARELLGQRLPVWASFAIPAGVMLFSVVASLRFGLVALVARGYGWIAFGFIAFFILPVLTFGVWRIWRGAAMPEPALPAIP